MHNFLKSSLMYGTVTSCDGGDFMKNFRFNTICNVSQEPQELQIVPVGSSPNLL